MVSFLRSGFQTIFGATEQLLYNPLEEVAIDSQQTNETELFGVNYDQLKEKAALYYKVSYINLSIGGASLVSMGVGVPVTVKCNSTVALVVTSISVVSLLMSGIVYYIFNGFGASHKRFADNGSLLSDFHIQLKKFHLDPKEEEIKNIFSKFQKLFSAEFLRSLSYFKDFSESEEIQCFGRTGKLVLMDALVTSLEEKKVSSKIDQLNELWQLIGEKAPSEKKYLDFKAKKMTINCDALADQVISIYKEILALAIKEI